ncbi:sensor histidine kinase [Marinobacterium arenosum]|uniref:sensor histidine kinase n=1 Tax=Marinobacterium arenosum TaxID=2862496 RepID=UPI001C9471EF|nr:ATP-binding protein [Marinobacterium arenosum]MBY4677929.1 PAS domain-containing protein [Marinobacterium arenosum]
MSEKPVQPPTLPDQASDEAWVSVIRKMDEAYADLIRYQVEVEQKNAELEQAQSFLDSVQSAMSDLLIVCDHQGAIIQANKAAEKLIGRDTETLVGLPILELVSEPFRNKLNRSLQQIRLQPLRDCELELLGPAGAVPLAVNCSARKDPRGRLLGMVLVGRPLGELQRAYKALNQAHADLKLAQERLVQAEKMASLGRLVAGVAHELNNPISFVYGNMHALQRYTAKLCRYFDEVHSGASREQLRQLRAELRLDKAISDLNSLVEGTMEGAERVRDIVRDLRQFSSCQASEKAEFDLIHVVHSAMHWILKESRREIAVDDRMPPQLAALGHAGQIHQVIVNLIQNAVDAMAESDQPALMLAAGDDGEQVWFELHDNGPGIAEADQLRILEPFFTTKPVGQGTGLGLSISYGIVSEHGGRLTVTNHPDSGVLARISLPKEADGSC